MLKVSRGFYSTKSYLTMSGKLVSIYGEFERCCRSTVIAFSSLARPCVKYLAIKIDSCRNCTLLWILDSIVPTKIERRVEVGKWLLYSEDELGINPSKPLGIRSQDPRN